MRCGGENGIGDGAKGVVGVPPSAPAGAPRPSSPKAPAAKDAPAVVDAYAESGAAAPTPAPVMTDGQNAYFKGAPEASGPKGEAAKVQPSVDSNEMLDEIFVEMRSASVPPSAVDSVLGIPPALLGQTPVVAPSAKSESYEFLGPSIDGSEYVKAVNEGAAGLYQLEQYASLSADRLVRTDAGNAEAGLAHYSFAAKSVYAEGINYGWTVSHALEFYKNSVFHSSRASMGGESDPVGIVGFNFGLNMTDLNKRDPSGKLGDILRDRMRVLANEEFGQQVWKGGYAGNGVRSADNVAATKNMTVLVMGASTDGTDMLTSQRADAGLARIQMGLQDYIDSDDFKMRMREAHGDGANGIHLEGMRIGLAGYYGETAIDPTLAKSKGKLETSIVEFLGEMHYGEDVASKEFRSGSPGDGGLSYTRTTSVGGSEGAKSATHSLYGLYASKSPGVEKVWEPGKAPADKLEVTEEDMMNGELLRPGHDFGMGLRHAREIGERYEALKDAVAAYKDVRENDPQRLDDALKRVEEARLALANYMENPPEAVDPSRASVMERLEGDFLRSRKVYRFRSQDGKSLLVYKPDHMPEVIAGDGKDAGAYKNIEIAQMGGDEFTAVVRLGNGKKVLVSVELGKISNYMAKYAAGQGIKDAAFAQIFDFILSGIDKAAPEANSAADIGEAGRGVVAGFEGAHAKMPFAYSEKVPLPGGVWDGVQFGVKGGKVHFKQPSDMSAAEFAERVRQLAKDEGFKKAMAENFPEAKALDDIEITKEAKYMELGDVGKRDVWHMEGAEHELHLNPGSKCASEGAFRPERTLTMQMAVAELEDVRDLPFLMGEKLPNAVQGSKKTGESVTVLPKLTASEKANARLEYRLAAGGASFVLGSVGAELIWNAMTGRDVFENVDVVHASHTYGLLTLGGAAGELVGRSGMAAAQRELFLRDAAGNLRFNGNALKTKYVGVKAKGLGAFSTVAALATVDYLEDGKFEVVPFLNTLAVLEGARYITGALRMIGPIRKATNFSPVKFVAEILVMKGIVSAEEVMIEDYMRVERRDAVADAMKRADAALDEMARAKASGDANAMSAAATAFSNASVDLRSAHGELISFEKYSAAEEFEPVVEAKKEADDMVDDLERIERTEGHDDDMPDHQKMNYMSPMSGSMGVVGMQLPKSMVEDVRERRREEYAEKKEASWAAVESAESAFRANTLGLEGRVSGSELHVPFSNEKSGFIASRTSSYEAEVPNVPMDTAELRYGPSSATRRPEDKAETDWNDRYYDGLSTDPHKLELQYILFMKERQSYFMDLITKSSEESEGD